MTKNTLYEGLVKKKKKGIKTKQKNQLQQTAKTTNSGERENLLFRIAIAYYLTYSVFNKKL